MVNTFQVSQIVVPKYSEISVAKIWSYVKEIPDLLEYFPDYDEGQLPERAFLFGVLSAVRPDELKALITDSRKKRSLNENSEENDLIYVAPGVKEEILSIPSRKCKHLVFLSWS